MDFAFLVQQLLNGLVVGSFLFLLAAGLNIIFGVSGIVNFAHGSFYMLGAYFAFSLATLADNFWVALLIAPVAVAVVGALAEWLLIRRFYGSDPSYTILVTFAILLVFDDLVKLVWGGEAKSVSMPEIFQGALFIFGRPFPKYYVFILAVTPLVLLFFYWLLYRTIFGKLIRAAAANRDMVAAMGVNGHTLFLATFMLGTWFGGFGGALLSPMRAVYPGVGAEVLISSFIVVVIGGLGSVRGALLGSLIIGQVQTFGILLVPEYELTFVYFLMAAMLIFRPSGLVPEME